MAISEPSLRSPRIRQEALPPRRDALSTSSEQSLDKRCKELLKWNTATSTLLHGCTRNLGLFWYLQATWVLYVLWVHYYHKAHLSALCSLMILLKSMAATLNDFCRTAHQILAHRAIHLFLKQRHRASSHSIVDISDMFFTGILLIHCWTGQKGFDELQQRRTQQWSRHHHLCPHH